MTEKKNTEQLEAEKDEILRRIAAKIKATGSSEKDFGASHGSHASGSKHSSSTG